MVGVRGGDYTTEPGNVETCERQHVLTSKSLEDQRLHSWTVLASGGAADGLQGARWSRCGWPVRGLLVLLMAEKLERDSAGGNLVGEGEIRCCVAGDATPLNLGVGGYFQDALDGSLGGTTRFGDHRQDIPPAI